MDLSARQPNTYRCVPDLRKEETSQKSDLKTRCEAAVAAQIASHGGGRGRALRDLSRANLGAFRAAHEDGPTDRAVQGKKEAAGSPVVLAGGQGGPVKDRK